MENTKQLMGMSGNMRDEIIVLCDLEVGGQRGRVFSPDGIIGALSATDYKDPPKALVYEYSDSRSDGGIRKSE